MSQEHDAVELVPDVTVAHVAKAVLLAALTAALAQVAIPVPAISVPFSLQPFGVFLAGIVLGPLWGGFAMLLYLVVGLAGAPVFANGAGGIGSLFSPSGGFLIGFVVGAVLIGAIAHRRVQPRALADLSVPVTAVGLGVGIVALYAVGIPWFAWIQGVSVARAAGVMAPFVPPDVIKAAMVLALVAGDYLRQAGLE